MTVLAAAVLGLIQGLTEFLPVSSSAHLALAHWLIPGWTSGEVMDLAFDVALHVGTLLALLVYFGKDWAELLRRHDRRLWYILGACVPGAIFGVLLEKKAESIFREPLRIAIMLAVMGLVLWAAEAIGKKTRSLDKMNWRDAIFIGLSQALAVMPGVSRSGITISTGLFLGLEREAAARFSFLLSTPIIAGAALLSARHLLHGGGGTAVTPLMVGVLTAGISGLACIHFLLRFLQKHTLYPFVVYRLAVAAAVVAVVMLKG